MKRIGTVDRPNFTFSHNIGTIHVYGCIHKASRHICPSDLETLRCLIISYQKVSLNHHLNPKNTFPRLLQLLLNIPTLLRALKDKRFIHQLE